MLVCHIFTGFERSHTEDKILIILREGRGDKGDENFIACVRKCQNCPEKVKCSGGKFKNIVIFLTFDMYCFLYYLEYGEM